MVDRVTRFGVSLPSQTTKTFDALIRKLGYTNRSKAIQDAIADFISQKRISQQGGDAICTISYTYDHHVSEVNKKLTQLQHDAGLVIKSTMHAHISHHDCVEVLIAEGPTKKIEKLYGGISAIRGVQACKLSLLKTKEP